MKKLRAFALLLLSASGALAQLTSDQKAFDIQDLAATFEKLYGPYEWKRDYLGFDLMDTAPWISRAAATQNDLDFYEVMAEYVAGLTDTHSVYLLPSNFSATLGFTVDIYDGKVIVDSVNRFLLPSVRYPINVGDELLTVDGANIGDLIPQYLPYHRYATQRPAMRFAANSVVNRIQAYNPYAANVGKSAVVGIRHAGGDSATLAIPWVTSGLPLTSIDPVAPLQSMSRRALGGAGGDLLAQLQTWEDPGPKELLGYGARNPVFNPPPGWTPRLGFNSGDEFLSGTFPSGNYTIGLLRIAAYAPRSTANALAQFVQVMSGFQ